MQVKAKGDYINGRFVRPRRELETILSEDPGDLDHPLGTFPVFAAAVDEALSSARAAFPAWAALPLTSRTAALKKLRAQLRNRGEELAALLSCETGQPIWETRSEVQAMHAELDALQSYGLAELQLRREPPGQSRVLHQPLGVVVAIAPSSQPALVLHRDTIAALAAGCAVVCKGSELTPAISQLYADLIHEADLPRGVFNLIQGGANVGHDLALSPQADGVLFTGSAAVGRELVARFCSSPQRRLRALIGGNATALVLDDANLDDAAYKIVIGGCIGAGQRCNSTRRVLVHRRVAQQLGERLTRLLEQLRVGYATEPGVFMGPLVSAAAQESFLEQTALAAADGHALVAGGRMTYPRSGHYVSPALTALSSEALEAAGDRDLVGPQLSLTPVGSLEEGLALALHDRRCLVLSVFCRSGLELQQIRQRQRCALLLHNLPTSHWPLAVPICPPSGCGTETLAGTMTVRACTRLITEVSGDSQLDLTALPPGLPRSL